MHLTGIKLGGIPPFTDPITLRFDERVNVFIGPNASGKSTLLQALDACMHDGADGKRWMNNPVGWWDYSFQADEVEAPLHEDSSVDVSRKNYLGAVLNEGESEEAWQHLTIVIGSVREGVRGILDQPAHDEYGETAEECLEGHFSGSRTMCAARLLGQEVWSGEEDAPGYPKRGVLLRAVEWAMSCSKQVCEEVIRESRLHNYITGPDIRGYLAHPFPNMNRITNLTMMGVNTTDKRQFEELDIRETPSESAYREDSESLPIYMGHLSSGTEGTLLWIFWLVLKMVQHYNFEAGWHQKPAILLIDEIENHLHPTWQRRVIPALLEHFPGLQIFATTHSPFVVAGLKAGQVHVLKRDANGVVTASTEQRDVIGWTMDEILRGMMGVDEPTDQLTVDRANRLRELREQETLTGEEETELNQLRRQVNSDLLSKGGLLESQRERYADLVQDFLRMRQNELTQDGE